MRRSVVVVVVAFVGPRWWWLVAVAVVVVVVVSGLFVTFFGLLSASGKGCAVGRSIWLLFGSFKFFVSLC